MRLLAYPAHALFVMGGTFGSGTDAEIWQCGIRGLYSYPGSDAAANLAARQASLTQWKAAIQTWFSASSTSLRGDATLTFLKLNSIGPDGHYVYPAYPLTVSASAIGNLTPTRPTFVTTAWSWKTARFAGPGSNGRIYPPNQPTASTTSPSRIGSSAASSQAAAAKALLTILLTDPATPVGVHFVPAVVSEQGVAEPITGVRVGDVMDVQRRRKDALREVYTAVLPVP